MLVALPLLLHAVVSAGQPGYYHPDFVGPHSVLFRQASEHVGVQFNVVQGDMARVSPDLVALDQNTALCAGRAPDPFLSYAAGLRREGAGQNAQVQAFVDTLVDDFEVTFGMAMERVLEQATAGYDVTLCKAEGIHAMMGRSQCEGTDLAPAIGALMDRDAELIEDVEEIVALSWPVFSIEGRAQPVIPVTGVGAYVDLQVLSDTLLTARIGEAKARHSAALEGIEADLEEGDTQAIRDAAFEKAQDYRHLYERELGELGEEFFGVLQATLLRLRKKGAPAAVGVCANPTGLGGCQGEDVTETLVPLLLADKKLMKAVAQ